MKVVLLAALVLFAGCATTAPQAKSVYEDAQGLPRYSRVPEVPFIEQEAGHCGPATLAMTMSWAGHPVSVDDLAPKVMTSAKAGSLQEDMVGATRREGLMAVRVDGYRALLSEVSAGHPVIVFENLGLSWYRQWHYAVVTGYDLDRRELILHSGPSRDERTDMKVFERSWKHSDYWALVVLPVGDLAVSAGELENVRAAAGLELAGHKKAAESAYRAVLTRWPQSLSAHVGLANIAYARGDYRSAIATLERTLEFHPASEIVQHNLEVARRASLQ